MDTHSSLYKISTLSKNKLDQLIGAFKNISNTPLLIYGPTGTGKSFHIRSIAAMLDMQLEYVMEPDKFSGKTLFKKHVIYIDTDDIRDLRNMPRNNVVIESRCISSVGRERNAMLIKFGKVSAIKIRKVLREYTESTTTTRRLNRACTTNEVL
ncbi:phosphate-transporting ATPase [Trachipleistophora hominis]|uniref:Phosphate-transporting ATPase n=1 Tax=Trachipleistophora hominis TaxID=72359 RepID=L7JQY1_TRAHO|nr:phosphate-transporting ATPase [Trachipleistophora hominis]